jgi:hypothetical protein
MTQALTAGSATKLIAPTKNSRGRSPSCSPILPMLPI